MKRLLLTSALAALPAAASAEPAAAATVEAAQTVDQALQRQADYWRSHGRPEVARQALQRLLIADPANAAARGELRSLDAPPAPQIPKPADLAAHGFEALNAGDLAGAEALFQRALADDPRQADALGGIGLVRLKAGRFDEAQQWLTRAAAISGRDRWAEPLAAAGFYALLHQAEAARDQGALDQAEALARPLASSGFKDHALAAALLADLGRRRSAADFDQALAAWRAGASAAADAAFQRSLAERPDAPWPRYRYAVFLADAHRTQEAQALMRDMPATSADARFATALFLDGTADPVEAAASLDAIPRADHNPDVDRFEQQLQCELAVRAARVLAATGRTQAATDGLRQLAETPGLSNAGLSLLADGLFELGDKALALELVGRIQSGPLSAPSDYQGAVSVLARAGQSDQAEALIARLRASADGPGAGAEILRLEARAALGAADRYSKQGRFARAIGELRRQLVATPDDPELQAALGRTWLAAGDGPRALQVFQGLVQARPDDEGAWRDLAAAALQAQNLPQARLAFVKAQALTPKDPALLLTSAEIDQASGDGHAALRGLRAAEAAHARAWAGDLDGLIDPRVLARTRGDFHLAAFTPDAVDATGEALRERLDRVADDVSPSLTPRLAASHRTGDGGLSRLTAGVADVAGASLVGQGRLELSLGFHRLDAGAMDAAGAAKFGVGPLNPVAAARGVSTAVSGAAVETAYTLGDLRAAAGVLQFADRPASFSGELRWTPRLGRDLQGELALSRQPVVDSLLSYAGMTDPRAEVSWGQVARNGARAGLTLTHGDAGVYGAAAVYAYGGRQVQSNASAKLDLGAYARLATMGGAALTGGVNLDVQAYRRNEDAFTFGHGGYFSPQQFTALTLPFRLARKAGPWRVEAEAAPGYQSYNEGDTPVFPTVRAWQDRLAGETSALPGSRKRGIGAEGQAKVEYAMGSRAVLAFEAGADTFGAYRETHALLRLKLRFDDPR